MKNFDENGGDGAKLKTNFTFKMYLQRFRDYIHF